MAGPPCASLYLRVDARCASDSSFAHVAQISSKQPRCGPPGGCGEEATGTKSCNIRAITMGRALLASSALESSKPALGQKLSTPPVP